MQVLVSALLVLLAACSSTGSGELAESASDSASPSSSHDLTVGGQERSYLLHVPPSYNGKPVPLLIALHPALATASRMEAATHFDKLADSEGFIVAYPQGVSRRWNAGKCCGPPMDDKVDDIGFVDAVVADITGRYAIDPARHFVTGFSNGAFLVHYIACQKPGDFAAYAAVAGTITTPDCNASQPTPFFIIHGNKDTEVAWDGGERWGYLRPSVPFALQTLAKRNRCSQNEVVTDSTPPATCRHYEGCGSNEVAWCVIDGVGHQWPGSGQAVWSLILGPNTDQFDASMRIWEFFKQHPKQTVAVAAPSSP